LPTYADLVKRARPGSLVFEGGVGSDAQVGDSAASRPCCPRPSWTCIPGRVRCGLAAGLERLSRRTSCWISWNWAAAAAIS